MGVDVRLSIVNRYHEEEGNFDVPICSFELGNLRAFRQHLPSWDSEYPCGKGELSLPAVVAMLKEGYSSYYDNVIDFLTKLKEVVFIVHWS